MPHDLALIKKTIKRDPSQFKVSKDECDCNRWHFNTIATDSTQDLDET